VQGDSLLQVAQDLSATGVDADVARQVTYDVQVDPGRQPAVVTGHVAVTVANSASTESRDYLSVYSPFALAGAQPAVTSASELGRRAYSASVSVPAHESRTLSLDVEGRLELADGDWYRLDLPHQTSLTPDATRVSLSVPSGWRIAEVRGPVRIVDDRHAVADLAASSNQTMSVRLERTPWSRLWARLRS
jgi:hypothetical protein